MGRNAHSVRQSNPDLTVSNVAPQHIPVLRNIQVGHGQGHAAIHSPARALLAQVEEASQLLMICGAQAVTMGHQVLCQVLKKNSHQYLIII